MTTFITKDAKPLFAKSLDHDHAPPHDMETYYSPEKRADPTDGEEQIVCTTDEREAFETDMQRAVGMLDGEATDTFGDEEDYDLFVRYLTENYGLERMD